MSDSQLPPPPVQDSKGSWFKRNAWWSIPAGCCGGLVLLLVLILAILGVVFGTLRSTEVYQKAVSTAGSHPAVQAEFGTPVDTEFWLTGSVEVSGLSGTADLAIPVSGPHAKGTLFTEAEKSGGKWTLLTLTVEVDGKDQVIDVLEAE